MLKLITLIKSRSKKLGVRCYQHRLPPVPVQNTTNRRFGVVGISDYSLWKPLSPRQLHINRFQTKRESARAADESALESSEGSGYDPGLASAVETGGPREDESTLRWGIAPVSLMADDFATALTVLPPNHHRIVSCVAAYHSHALAFAERHNVPNIYTSFEALAKCPNIDVVYISPLNPQHSELCNLMLNHDKHVLCEKPLCMTERQVSQVLAKARARQLFLMEGMWPRCVPAYHYIRHQILRNRLGEVQHVHCTLGLPIVASRLAMYGGVTSDFGVYGLQLALWVFRDVPQTVKVSGRVTEDKIDVAADIDLIFSDNKTAKIEVSAEERLSNMAVIQGKIGCIKMANYWCPTRLVTEEADYDFPLPEVERTPPTHYHNRLGMCYEAEEVRNCIRRGSSESAVFNHNESLLLANLIDTIHAELGVGMDFSSRCVGKQPPLEEFDVKRPELVSNMPIEAVTVTEPLKEQAQEALEPQEGKEQAQEPQEPQEEKEGEAQAWVSASESGK